jgi:pyruvate,water dikinase
MGLALLDVADVVRDRPAVVAQLELVAAGGAAILDGLARVAGGEQAHDAIERWLDAYGMRGPGEIDITRPRWREQPAALAAQILHHVRSSEPGAGPRRFAQGRAEAAAKEQELLARLRRLPDGMQKAAETARMIGRVRAFAGYREFPKYGIVARTFAYKQALLGEAERLVRAGVLRAPDDIFFLTIQELQEVARTQHVDEQLVADRRETQRRDETLRPPRVLTSEGEVLDGSYRRDDLPAGALAGLAVSGGAVEGRARVALDVAKAELEPGDILVTTFTDPGWTPLFVSAAALVTEVGGLMTHGAVIAREYGLPAVVGVQGATRLIRDGQRIRVDGTRGLVELLL